MILGRLDTSKSIGRHYSQIMLHPFKDHEWILGLRCLLCMRITLVWPNDIVQSPNVLTRCNALELIVAMFAFQAYFLRPQLILYYDTKIGLAITASN